MRLHKGSTGKHYENYGGRFPDGGVQKEEVQQWRQARARPGNKETLNIMLKEKELKGHLDYLQARCYRQLLTVQTLSILECKINRY